MSDTPQGEGWWQASDGKFYPPQEPTQVTPPAQPTEQQPAGQQVPPAPGQAQQGAVPPPFTGTAGSAPGDPNAPGAPPEEEEKKGKGKLIAILIVVLLAIAGAIGAFLYFGGDDDSGDADTADSEPKDIGDATGEVVNDGPIEFNKEYTTTLEGERTEALYTLDAPDGAIMTVQVANARASERSVRATYETPEQRFVDVSVNPGAEDGGRVVIGAGDAATFELGFTGGPAEFTFRVDLEIQDDAGQGGDAGPDVGSAFEVSAGADVQALLGGTDETDYFTVPVEPGTEFSFKGAVQSDAERSTRFVVEFNGDRLFDSSVQPGQDDTISLLLANTDEGTLEVSTSGGIGVYSFTADFNEVTDGGEPGDAPDDLGDARAVDPASAVEGSVGDLDTGDYYTFTPSAATFNVTLTSGTDSERSYRVTIEDTAGTRVLDKSVNAGATLSESVELEAVGELRMHVTGGRADYTIELG